MKPKVHYYSGQVISGNHYWSDGTPVSGQQFTYSFDTIGNRKTTTAGGSRTGDPLRTTTYAPNRLNQYASRTTSPSPTYADILGVANPTADVKVSIDSGTEYTAYRKGEYYHHALAMPNGSAQYPQIGVRSLYGAGVLQQGHIFVPPTSETFTPDADGNLSSDGRWQYTWDGENRLVKMVSLAGPAQILRFDYDFQSRRIRKRVWNGTDDTLPANVEQRFIYDGWNLIATLNAQLSTLNSFVWGTDLSGSMQGAGGVGGLLKLSDSTGDYFTAFDGKGNVAGLVKAADRSYAARYEYGPFGELLRCPAPWTTPVANPFRFSTKYRDDETDLLYYGYRYYDPRMGRWLSSDPLGEWGESNLSGFLENDPILEADYLGLSWWKKYKLLEKAGELVLENGKVLALRNSKFRNKTFTIKMLRECGSKVKEARFRRLEERYGKDLKIEFDKAAQPDFSPYVKAKPVDIKVTGNQAVDGERAWAELERITQKTREQIVREFGDVELNWHHAGDGKMQLIDADLNAAFAHTGEAAAMRASVGETMAALAAPGVVKLYREKVDKGVCSCQEAFVVTFVDGVRFIDPGFEDAAEFLWDGTRAAAKREVERALQGKPMPFNPGLKW